MGRGQLKLFSGSAHPALTAEIGEFLGVPIGHSRLQRFPDTEVSFQIDENIRGADVFIVQPTCGNPVNGMTPNDSLMELLLMIDAAVGASAHRVIAVTPWFGYSRQDKKSSPREPISARLVARALRQLRSDTEEVERTPCVSMFLCGDRRDQEGCKEEMRLEGKNPLHLGMNVTYDREHPHITRVRASTYHLDRRRSNERDRGQNERAPQAAKSSQPSRDRVSCMKKEQSWDHLEMPLAGSPPSGDDAGGPLAGDITTRNLRAFGETLSLSVGTCLNRTVTELRLTAERDHFNFLVVFGIVVEIAQGFQPLGGKTIRSLFPC